MSDQNYHPEPYWSDVAKLIGERHGTNVIAGDDEPYYRYKRKMFLKMLFTVPFEGKKVLEIGSGPGGNLVEVFKKKPAVLNGVDISSDMIALAKKHVPASVEIFKSNGTQLPFDDNQFDIIFTATVLQHNTDDAMLRELIAEICRVSGDRVYIFERIENSIKGDALCLGRPVDYYASIFKAHGFELQETQFINIRVSYYICGAIRKLLNPKDRKEGEPLNGISIFLQNAFLMVTPLLDRIFTSGKDVGKLVFKKLK